MDSTVSLLQTYGGRDKFMRTTAYVAGMLSGSTSGKASQSLTTIAQRISAARMVLRLFDDLPMLMYTTKYGCGSHERDPVTRVLSMVGNLAIQVFFPLEHISWLGDGNVLNVNSSKWSTAAISCWAISLCAGILRSLRALMRINFRKAKLIKQRKLESPEKSGSADQQFRESMRELGAERFNEYLNLIKNTADLMNAVNWLPKGFLWAGRFTAPKTGLFGSISSIVGLSQLYMAQKKKTE